MPSSSFCVCPASLLPPPAEPVPDPARAASPNHPHLTLCPVCLMRPSLWPSLKESLPQSLIFIEPHFVYNNHHLNQCCCFFPISQWLEVRQSERKRSRQTRGTSRSSDEGVSTPRCQVRRVSNPNIPLAWQWLLQTHLSYDDMLFTERLSTDINIYDHKHTHRDMYKQNACLICGIYCKTECALNNPELEKVTERDTLGRKNNNIGLLIESIWQKTSFKYIIILNDHSN